MDLSWEEIFSSPDVLRSDSGWRIGSKPENGELPPQIDMRSYESELVEQMTGVYESIRFARDFNGIEAFEELTNREDPSFAQISRDLDVSKQTLRKRRKKLKENNLMDGTKETGLQKTEQGKWLTRRFQTYPGVDDITAYGMDLIKRKTDNQQANELEYLMKTAAIGRDLTAIVGKRNNPTRVEAMMQFFDNPGDFGIDSLDRQFGTTSMAENLMKTLYERDIVQKNDEGRYAVGTEKGEWWYETLQDHYTWIEGDQMEKDFEERSQGLSEVSIARNTMSDVFKRKYS